MKRVLIVDDDTDILESLSAILGDRFETASARNGAVALQALEQHSFHAVVLDLTMPVMDGETLIEKMRIRGIAVPVVLASGFSDLQKLAGRLGVDHISKPYDMQALIVKLALITRDSEAK